MKDAATIERDVKNKTEDFEPRFTRMDKDFNRWALKNTGVVANPLLHKKQKRDTDIKVISNDFRTFSDDVQSILSASERQIRVRMAELQGEDMREGMGKLERLLEYALEKADERLIDLGLPTHKESSVWRSMVRGWLAGRFLVYKYKSKFIFDFLSYDARWLTFQMGANGLLWTNYVTPHDPEELEDVYGKNVTDRPWYKPWSKTQESYDVNEYWQREKKGMTNAITCKGVFLKEPKTYKLDSMPVLIAPVATRPPVRGASGNSEMAGYGESIFAPNREIGNLLNELASMWASHANLLYKQPMINLYGKQGIQLDTTAYLAEAVLNLPKGENELFPAPMKEISPTLVNLVNWAESKRVRGSLPDIDIGKPPPSGTLYNLVQETSNRVFNPQLRNLNSYYSNACRLIEEQLLAGGVGGEKITKLKFGSELRGEYKETEITMPDLKRAHIIKVEHTARTPWQQMDVWQIADMAKRQGLPEGWINENILKVQDPKGIGDESAIEMAEHSPKLAVLRAVKALWNKKRYEEAMSLIQDMYNMQMQEAAQTQGMQGQVAPEEEAPPPPVGEGAPEEAPPEVTE